ncbi:CLUMA_CG014598, isoform A [Clunio marinus]|uniref:CLUMA_CG014598, isoform A n=1 Tax=Clunio marinus TaxID=568069 RepID=A0A1J1IM81_9DIPT|nr:CLUMA_CG014598, isoform A [Clunio marinus]
MERLSLEFYSEKKKFKKEIYSNICLWKWPTGKPFPLSTYNGSCELSQYGSKFHISFGLNINGTQNYEGKTFAVNCSQIPSW